MNDLSTNIKETSSAFNKPSVAITALIVVGIFAIYKIHMDAKYNRQTFCSYDATNNRFVFSSQPAIINNTAVCPT